MDSATTGHSTYSERQALIRQRIGQLPDGRQTAPYSPELEPDIILTRPQTRHRVPPVDENLWGVYVAFERKVSWHVVFSDSHTRKRLCTLLFQDESKLYEMVKHGGALTNLESKQAIELSIADGKADCSCSFPQSNAKIEAVVVKTGHGTENQTLLLPAMLQNAGGLLPK